MSQVVSVVSLLFLLSRDIFESYEHSQIEFGQVGNHCHRLLDVAVRKPVRIFVWQSVTFRKQTPWNFMEASSVCL